MEKRKHKHTADALTNFLALGYFISEVQIQAQRYIAVHTLPQVQTTWVLWSLEHIYRQLSKNRKQGRWHVRDESKIQMAQYRAIESLPIN